MTMEDTASRPAPDTVAGHTLNLLRTYLAQYAQTNDSPALLCLDRRPSHTRGGFPPLGSLSLPPSHTGPERYLTVGHRLGDAMPSAEFAPWWVARLMVIGAGTLAKWERMLHREQMARDLVDVAAPDEDAVGLALVYRPSPAVCRLLAYDAAEANEYVLACDDDARDAEDVSWWANVGVTGDAQGDPELTPVKQDLHLSESVCALAYCDYWNVSLDSAS